MESKKLPVLYYWPGESLEQFVDLKPFEGCEPCIPAARVREKIAELEHFLSGLKPPNGPNGLEDDIRSAIEGYRSLIEDV